MKPNFFSRQHLKLSFWLDKNLFLKSRSKENSNLFPIQHLGNIFSQFSNFSDYDDLVTYTYYLIRVILKLKNGGDKEFEQLPNGQKRYFKDLISHRNEIQQDENKMFIFMGIYSYLQLCFDESDLLLNLPKNDVLEIFGKVFINR